MELVGSATDIFPDPRHKLAEKVKKQARPLFQDDKEKYMAMDPEVASRELGITVSQMMQLVDEEEDLFPNPRHKLAEKKKTEQRPNAFLERLRQARANKLPESPRLPTPPPPFKINTPGGVALNRKIGSSSGSASRGLKIGQNAGPSKVSDPATAPPFCSCCFCHDRKFLQEMVAVEQRAETITSSIAIWATKPKLPIWWCSFALQLQLQLHFHFQPPSLNINTSKRDFPHSFHPSFLCHLPLFCMFLLAPTHPHHHPQTTRLEFANCRS